MMDARIDDDDDDDDDDAFRFVRRSTPPPRLRPSDVRFLILQRFVLSIHPPDGRERIRTHPNARARPSIRFRSRRSRSRLVASLLRRLPRA